MLAHTGMLRWSAQTTETPVDLQAVTNPDVDPLLPAGRELVAFVDGVLTSGRGDPKRLARRSGWEATVMASAVIGNFQMMNRVADATGMPVGKGVRARNADLIEALELDRFDHLEEQE